MTKHYVYITTCLINNKKYIGQHITRSNIVSEMLTDGYLGSGVVLMNAIKKYGKKSFTKIIIEVFDTQKEADLFEIEYIKSFNVLNDKDQWYNRAAGGQFNRSEDHSEAMSVIMKEVCSRPEYRESQGWLSLEDQKTKKLRGIRIYLINTIRAVKNIKTKEEKQSIATANGYKTYKTYSTHLLHQTSKMKNTLLEHNKYMKSAEGREMMSNARTGIVPVGRGMYTPEEFDRLLTENNINNKQAGEILNCHPDTIRFQRQGWQIQKGKRGVRHVKDSYYLYISKKVLFTPVYTL